MQDGVCNPVPRSAGVTFQHFFAGACLQPAPQRFSLIRKRFFGIAKWGVKFVDPFTLVAYRKILFSEVIQKSFVPKRPLRGRIPSRSRVYCRSPDKPGTSLNMGGTKIVWTPKNRSRLVLTWVPKLNSFTAGMDLHNGIFIT
jgi:hypothetical protein